MAMFIILTRMAKPATDTAGDS
ncbi:MAG: hypothetical protein RLZZ300_479, partial [Pseudomonadota bacterium]